ncbi:MAG: 50S ribosomal protein L18 [Gammaproteobacteria bacterium]|nr:50S ribosomal protein L18 [Gammaproteobacteria bacterium]
MHTKKAARMRRARKARAKLRDLGGYRLCVNRTPRHIYAQVIAANADETLVSASTVDQEIGKELGYGGNTAAAMAVGKAIAERAKAKGISKVSFDRSGFKYHGRVKALADAARKAGLEF